MLFGITAGGLASGHTLHRGRRQRLPEVGGAGTSAGGRGGGCHKTGLTPAGTAGAERCWLEVGDRWRRRPAAGIGVRTVVDGDFFRGFF